MTEQRIALVDRPTDGVAAPVEPLLVELSAPGRGTAYLPELDVPEAPLPDRARAHVPLPEVSEIDVVRHFSRLSSLNYGIDRGFYPLGSCTMKYNPRVNETVARLAGFLHVHPLQDEATVQGALELLWALQEALIEIAGMDACSVQPAAGAQGELTGVLMIRAYHADRNDDAGRDIILVPDSAHGTNPATASMVGYDVRSVASDARGNVDLDALRAAADERVAGMMITNPNTLGLFEEQIADIAAVVHEVGGLVYTDGANMNALLGVAKPGELGMDILHYNLHKTFSTPHGGGGPGAGATAVVSALEPFLPRPLVVRRGERFALDDDRPKSIGRVHGFHGNFSNSVRGYAYIAAHGRDGLLDVSRAAVLNANYVRSQLAGHYEQPYDRLSMHEAILTGRRQAARGVRTLDIAKRLQDYGMHPPTIYFPLTVPEAMLIEPTETESKASMDGFIRAMKRIADEVKTSPELVLEAPHTTPVRRLDEAGAARKPKLTWA